MTGFQASTNADAVALDLHRAAAALVDLDDTNTEAGRIILAKANPPRKSGALAAGMFARADDTGTILASSVPYWTFIHWGAPRRHVRAQPFLLTATRASKAEVLDLYTDHARHAVGLVKD